MDLDGDGRIDMISGSWPGELFLFRGGPDRSFAAKEAIKDRDGKIINVGGGVRPSKGVDDMLVVAGDARVEQTPEGAVVVYHDERIKVKRDRSVGITGTASAVHAVDWDGDGDLDLLVGDIQGNVNLVPNEGTAQGYAFGTPIPLQVEGRPDWRGRIAQGLRTGKVAALTAAGNPLRVEGDAGPFVADWDGDGDLDLLVGAGDGSVSLFRNIGTAKAPKLAAAEVLVPPSPVSFGGDASKTPRRGMRSKVCAVDWNGDGRLDLLVGDFTTQAPDLPRPTPAEKAAHDELRNELAKVQGRYQELVSKLYGPKKPTDKTEQEAVRKDFQGALQRMREIGAKLPAEYENHGWVWLFLRKPAETAAGGG